MRFYKLALLTLSLVICNNSISSERTLGVTTEEALAEANKKGWFEGLDLTGQKKASQKDVDDFLANAQNQIQKVTRNALDLPEENTKPNSPIMMFVSLSMPRASLIDAFKNAAASNTTVYINGMFKGDKNIMTTMKRLELMAKDMLIKPTVKFGPTWFKKYNIQRVPALVFDDNKIQVTLKGITHLEFLNQKLSITTETTDLGYYGATFPVEEESLIEQIRKLMKKIDWESKKKAAVDNYWKKRTNTLLGTILENKTFYIDPTVRVQKDIINKAGVVLARAGTTINPLTAIHGAHLGLYVINPLDKRQLKWLDSFMGKFDYRDQIIVTELDSTRGWEHLSELRKRYKREVFLLERELVTKFALKSVPSKVSVEKGYLRIDEIGMRNAN